MLSPIVMVPANSAKWPRTFEGHEVARDEVDVRVQGVNGVNALS